MSHFMTFSCLGKRKSRLFDIVQKLVMLVQSSTEIAGLSKLVIFIPNAPTPLSPLRQLSVLTCAYVDKNIIKCETTTKQT